MTKVHNLDTPLSYVYEDDDCLVRVCDKGGEPLTYANAFYAVCKAALDLIMTTEDDEG